VELGSGARTALQYSASAETGRCIGLLLGAIEVMAVRKSMPLTERVLSSTRTTNEYASATPSSPVTIFTLLPRRIELRSRIGSLDWRAACALAWSVEETVLAPTLFTSCTSPLLRRTLWMRPSVLAAAASSSAFFFSADSTACFSEDEASCVSISRRFTADEMPRL
jgi:hypothetical protein